ncbi:MAG: hypothetical protein JOZ69_23175 [Myxococcales bacterium]|nr:hypothetical protein [Myxococcales bacterium]
MQAPQPATTASSPNAPAGANGQSLAWPAAPVMDGAQVVPERDSVRVVLPAVSGAVDFRLFPIDSALGVTATSGGKEHIQASTVVCAGYRQRGIPTSTYELAPAIEFPGVTQPTTFVLEAIDTTCPYTGPIGPSHGQINAQNPEIDPGNRGNYDIYTESEVAAKYDAVILNGQGWNSSHIGHPAPPVDPKVLARTTLVVTPQGYGAPPPTKTFFDDFSSEDPLTLYTTGADPLAWNSTQFGGVYVEYNSKWSFFGAGTSLTFDQGTSFQPVFFEKNRMHLLVSDGGQSNFTTFLSYPKKAAKMPDASSSGYLHVTYEVNDPVTDRRYWWLNLCGPDSATAALMDANGLPLNVVNPDSSLQNGGARNFGSQGWNCLAVIPRNATVLNGCAPLGPDNTNPETDIGLFVFPSGQGSTSINISPPQYGSETVLFDPRWYRQMDGNGNLTGPMLDDQNYVAPTTKFDVYVRNNRVVLYVNGQQRLCNDFPSTPLTMKNAMVGFGQVLYHTADEHVNVGPNGQYCAPVANTPSMRHVYYNEPYVDARDWDNVGFDEGVSLPGDMPAFDPTACYSAK